MDHSLNNKYGILTTCRYDMTADTKPSILKFNGIVSMLHVEPKVDAIMVPPNKTEMIGPVLPDIDLHKHEMDLYLTSIRLKNQVLFLVCCHCRDVLNTCQSTWVRSWSTNPINQHRPEMARGGGDGNNLQSIWWRHDMEMFSAFLALCSGNPPVTGEFLSWAVRNMKICWCQSEEVVEQTVELTVIWNAMAVILRNCNVKRDSI